MLKRVKISIAICFLGLQVGCATHLTQQEVASEFWTAVVAKDIAKAKTFTKQNVIDDGFLSGDVKVEKLDLMPFKAEKGQTCLPTRLTTDENGELKTIAFDTFLEKIDDDWKVDIEKTTHSLHDFSGKK